MDVIAKHIVSKRREEHLQWVAEVRRIGCENEPANAEFRSAPLLELVRTDVQNFVVTGLWMAGKDLFVSHRLSLSVLFCREAGDFRIGDSVQAVVADLGDHVPVLGVDDVVGVPVAVFCEVVVYLCHGISI